MDDLPIACELTSAELQQRRTTILEKIRHSVVEVTELENGFAYSFSPAGEQFKELTGLIDLERRCCPFLRFHLIVEPGGGPFCLEITGPEGTKDFLANIFN